MSVVITDAGFGPGTGGTVVPLAELTEEIAVDLSNTDDPALLAGHLDRLGLIRIAFPAFNDGRAFTIARRLREMGFKGTILALGPVIADQYAMLRRVGFDGAEIPDDLAARQPAGQWQFRADWPAHHYQARLRA